VHTGVALSRALAGIAPASFDGDVARRVGLGGLLTPLKKGLSIKDLEFLYASRRRNRFTLAGGPHTIYFGEDEDVGSAEVKRVALLGAFAKVKSPPAVVFWATAHLPDAVLDLTDPAVIAALGATDAELHDPDWRRRRPPSASELVGQFAFASKRFAAIKYWSVRERIAGRKRFCLCIFKDRMKGPLKVDFDFEGKIESWP
jgi:hypothetical protein